jgi:hypothetical protein
MLVGKPWIFRPSKGQNDTMFQEREISEQPRDNSEYNVIFGKSVYDFRNIGFPDNKPIKVKLNTVFGNTVIRIKHTTPVRIKSDAVFASAYMPDGNSVAFGSIQFATDTVATSLSHLFIDAPVVFGAVQVVAED